MSNFSAFFEEWRPVKRFEDAYEISNFARIRSLSRSVRYKEITRNVSSRFLRFQLGTHGYLAVQLYLDSISTTFTVHGLVAEAFLGARPIGSVVHHIDANKLNNYACNLVYVPFHENLEHRRLSRGERHYAAKLRDKSIPLIRNAVAAGCELEPIARFYRVSSATISEVIKRKTWKHVA